MLVAAARRLVLLLAGLGGATAAASVLLGLIVGASLNRALSLGLYVVGAILLVGAFLVGNRSVLRPHHVEGSRLARGVRRAEPEEVREGINLAVLLGAVGLLMIAAATAIDTRYDLV